MPESKSVLQTYNDEAVNELNYYFLNERNQSFQLEPPFLDSYRRYKPVAGWRSVICFDASKFDVDVLVDNQFPFSTPKVALVDKSFFLKWPHVEEDGTLCLLPSHATHTHTVSSKLVEYLLDERAKDLLRACKSGENKEDLIREFDDYWWRTVNDTLPRVWCALQPVPLSRKIVYWPGKKLTLIHDGKEALETWLHNYYGNDAKEKYTVKESLFLWLDTALYPDDYPTSNLDIAEIAKKEGKEVYELLVNSIPKEPDKLLVIMGFESGNGPALTGTWLYEPKTVSIPGKVRKNERYKGFRPGKMSQHQIAAKYLTGSSKVARVPVRRVDSEWVHTRGGDHLHTELAAKKAVIIGCGALGATVSQLMVKAGITELTLIDPDIIKWDNIGRHLLGSKNISKNKATALDKHLRENLPHARIGSFDSEWAEVFEKNEQLFLQSDLIVTTIGSWAAESQLNYLHKNTSGFPPVLYGWTEAHGCAGHALVVMDEGGCFACGMSKVGEFEGAVTDWGEGAHLKREPACGGFFQPFGITEISFIHSMITDMAVNLLTGNITKSQHSIWVGSKVNLDNAGGKWREAWIKKYSDPGDGFKFIREEWPVNKDCVVC